MLLPLFGELIFFINMGLKISTFCILVGNRRNQHKANQWLSQHRQGTALENLGFSKKLFRF